MAHDLSDLPHDTLWVEVWGSNYRSNPEFQEKNAEFRRGRDIGMIRIDVNDALRYRAESAMHKYAISSTSGRGW